MAEEIMSEGGGGNGAPNQKKRSLSPGTSKSSPLSTKRLRLKENTAVGGTSQGNRTLSADLLQLIKWKDINDNTQELRLYQVLATVWIQVSDLIGLDMYTRMGIEQRHPTNHVLCVQLAIEEWIKNMNLKISAEAKRLKEALEAVFSSFAETSACKGDVEENLIHHPTFSFDTLIRPTDSVTVNEGNEDRRDLSYPGLLLDSHMTDIERKRLKYTLEEKSNEMMCKFARIRRQFSTFLEENGSDDAIVKLKDILFDYVGYPPLFQNRPNYPTIDKDLEKANSITEIKRIINSYSSFFNIKMLEIVFDEMGYREGKVALDRHKEDIAEYAKKRIYHFPSGLGIKNAKHIVVAVKLDDAYKDCTGSHLITLHNNLCQLLKVSLGQFQLDGLQPGCISIMFHLPEFLRKIFPLTREQISELQRLRCHHARIIKLSCEDLQYDIIKSEHSGNSQQQSLNDVSDSKGKKRPVAARKAFGVRHSPPSRKRKLYKFIVRVPLKSHYTANEASCSTDVSEAKQQLSNLRSTLTTAFNQLDQLEEKISAISQRSSYLAVSPQSSNSYMGTVSTDHNISPSSSCSTLISQEKTHVTYLEEDELCTYDSSTSHKITAQDSISDIESSSDYSKVKEKPLPSLKDAVKQEDQSDNSDLHTGQDTPSVLEKPIPSLKDVVKHEDQSDYSPSVLTIYPGTVSIDDLPCIQKLKEGLLRKVTMYISQVGISGPPGIGKSHLRALLLGELYPEIHQSTAISTTADEIMPGELADNKGFITATEKEIKGKEDIFTWSTTTKSDWAKLLAFTIYNGSDISSEDIADLKIMYGKHGSKLPGLFGMILTQLKNIKPVKKGHKKKTMKDIFLVYLVDAGGQPQFQEILPNFIQCSINILVHNLSKRLGDFPEFSYEVDGKKYDLKESMKMSNLSIIEQSVRSICSVIRTKEEDMEGVPQIAIIGTFKDKFQDNNDLRKVLQQKSQIISTQLHPFMSSTSKLCECLSFTRNQIIFPIDGSKEGWFDNSEVMEELKYKIYKNRAKVEMPLWHVIFMQNMKETTTRKRNKNFYLTLEECIKIGKSCQVYLTIPDIEEALCKFHNVNLILYFPDSLKNIIFIDPSFLYKMVTDIIVRSFHSSESGIENLNFNKTGIMTESFLEHIPSFQTLTGNFTKEDFLKLLQDLLIIANIDRDTYFMPCVLPLEDLGPTYEPTSEFAKKEIKCMKEKMIANNIDGPLVISFGNGISPRGLFCSIVVELSQKYKWKLANEENHIRRRNMIEFSVYSYNTAGSMSINQPTLRGTALIFDKVTYLEVYTSCDQNYCYVIHHAIRNCLYIACEKMKYSTEMLALRIGLYCNSEICKKYNHECHPSECSYKNDSNKWVENCKARRSHAITLSPDRAVWFSNKDLDEVATSKASLKEIDIPELLHLIGGKSHLWKMFAVQLIRNLDSIKRIEQDYDKSESRLIEVIRCWKNHDHPPFSWATIENVFRKINECSLANTIKRKYLTKN